MDIKKEIDLINQKVKFTFEINLQEASEYMKHLENHEWEPTLDLIPDDVIVYLIDYKLKKYNEKKK